MLLILAAILTVLASRPANDTAGTAGASASEPLLVSAASSLSEPLQSLAAATTRDGTTPMARFNLGASGTLRNQIAAGAPVDVFISAGVQPMNELDRQGLLLPGSRRDIAANALVLVVPERSSLSALRFEQLAGAAVKRLAIGDSNVPAGDYARQTLAHYGLTGALRQRLVPLPSARAVAAAVAAGAVEAGIVYRSDVRPGSRLRITAVAPAGSHAPIVYSAAVIRSSGRPRQALHYVQSLSGAAAQGVFRRFGLPPAGAAAPGR